MTESLRDYEGFSSFETLEDSLFLQESLFNTLKGEFVLDTVEIFKPNAYYGLDRIVKEFLDIPTEAPLPFAVGHGVTFGIQPGVYVYGRREPVPILTYCNDIDLDIISALKSNRTLIHVPHLFSLLVNLRLNRHDTLDKLVFRENLFFPPHSNVDWRLRDATDGSIIEMFGNMGLEPKNTSIMLPLTAILAGRHLQYQRVGFTILTAGHVYDPKFIFRWINLVGAHSRVVVCNLGSHLFFSLYLQRKVTWLGINNLNAEKVNEMGQKRPPVYLSSEAVDVLHSLRQGHGPDRRKVLSILGIHEESKLISYFEEQLKDSYTIGNRMKKLSWYIRKYF